MYRSILLAATLSATLAIVASARSVAVPGPDPVVQANTDFALDLYRQLASGGSGKNLFFSPYSISSALAMTWDGARGNTASEMANALRFSPRDGKAREMIHSAFGRLNDRFNAKDQAVELAVANALWGEKTMPFKPDFLAAMNRHYGAGLFPADFTGNPEAERNRINRWVEKQTRDKIKDVLPRGAIDNLTRLVLTNAIYFKGDWQTQFTESMTRPQPFHVGEGKSVQVPLMFLPRGRFAYHGDKDVQVLELPYRGDELSMVVLLPTKSAGGLVGLEKKLSSKRLAGWIQIARRQPVNVFLPKFKLETQYDLVPPLKALGMKDAFVFGQADFTGLSESEKLYISAVLHKAFVEVNEEGTEAAAATAVVVSGKSLKPRVPTFRADRPFVFLIRDRHSGSILFLGRVTNPKG